MKKLSLKNLGLNGSDLLHRNQLKTVFGGDGGYGGGSTCKGKSCTYHSTGSTGCDSQCFCSVEFVEGATGVCVLL